jgi:hypothetical protein
MGGYDIWLKECGCHDLPCIMLDVYIDDFEVKLAEFEDHFTDLRLVFEKNEEVWDENEPVELRLWGVGWAR